MEMKSKLEQSIILTYGDVMNKVLEEYLYFMYENRRDMIEDPDDVTQTDVVIKQIESILYGRYCYDNKCKAGACNKQRGIRISR